MMKFNKFISFLLVFVFLFNITSQPVMAIGYNNRKIEYNFEFNVEDVNAKQIFNDLSPEAKQIFLEYLLTENNEMLDYHIKHVGDINIEDLESKSNDLQSVASVNTGAIMNTLNLKLNALYLSEAVKFALMGAASSMCASIATLGATTVFSILVTVGCASVIIANWDSISSKWNSIIGAFQQSFGQAYSSVLTSGFSQAKTSYVGHYTTMTGIDYAVKSAPLTNSVAKHIDMAFVDNIRKKVTSEIYYGPKTHTALVKFVIGSGMTGNLNTSWSKVGAPYDNLDYNLGGATLFILYNTAERKIFHAHIRVAGSQYIAIDTETMRRANNLTYKVKPFPIQYNSVYENTRENAYFPANQIAK